MVQSTLEVARWPSSRINILGACPEVLRALLKKLGKTVGLRSESVRGKPPDIKPNPASRNKTARSKESELRLRTDPEVYFAPYSRDAPNDSGTPKIVPLQIPLAHGVAGAKGVSLY